MCTSLVCFPLDAYENTKHFLHLTYFSFDVNEDMIRLPPSAITLGTSDLRDFECSQRRNPEVEGSPIDETKCSFLRHTLTIQTRCRPTPHSDFRNSGDERSHVSGSTAPSGLMDIEYTTFTDLTEDQDGYLPTGRESSPENVSVRAQPSATSKSELHHIDFVDSAMQHAVSGTSQQSTPFGIPAIS